MAPFDVQSGVQSGIRIGECVFPLCETAESFPEGSLSTDFPAAIVPQDVRCGNIAGTLKLGRKWIIVLALESRRNVVLRCSSSLFLYFQRPEINKILGKKCCINGIGQQRRNCSK